MGSRSDLTTSLFFQLCIRLTHFRLLYVLGAYQRSTLMGFTAACGSGLLMPVRSRECPNESEILALPTCHQGLLTEAFCEADIQVGEVMKEGITQICCRFEGRGSVKLRSIKTQD